MFNRSTTPQKDMKQNTAGRARNAGDAETAGKVLFAKNKQERREDQMDSLKRELLIRKQSLEKAIEKAESAIADAPEGTLRIDASKEKVRFYHVEKSGKKKYIAESNTRVIDQLAQKGYSEKMISKACREIKEIDAYLKLLNEENADREYALLGDVRKKRVTPYLIDEETFCCLWNTQMYEKSNRHPEHLKFKTRKGELVRSKSEASIANIYFEMGIPYRYECALSLDGNIVLHPDFTLLNTAHRRIMYHEHLGRLDKPGYLEDQMWKFKVCQKNGIFIGKNLIITAETEDHPFDQELFRKSVKDIFL